MQFINRVELVGIVGSIRKRSVSGRIAVSLSVATEYCFTDRNGSPIIETTWHSVSAFDGPGIPDLEKLEKGSKVRVSGRIRTSRITTPSGEQMVITEVLAKSITLIK